MQLHRFASAASAALLAASLGSAHAASISYSAAAMPVTETDWSSFAELQKFDLSLGTLQQVTLRIDADLAGSAAGESTNNKAVSITLTLQATLALARPDDAESLLVQTTPLVSQTFAAARHDGLIDYQGASGITFGNLTASSSSSESYTDGATLALFTGQGSVLLPFTAVGTSYSSGSGNLWVDFASTAGGRASVTYLYDPAVTLPPVPEPASWALLLVGMAAVGWKASRRNG